jgi:hypothetical protein
MLPLRLLDLLLSPDPAVRAQGEELLASSPALHEATFGTDGVAWQTMAGLELCLTRSSAAPEAKGRWGIACAEKALPLLRRLAPDTHHYGLISLRALAAGAPPDSAVAIAELISELSGAIHEEDLEDLGRDLASINSDIRDYLSVWFNNAYLLEDPLPDDEINEITADLEAARAGVMRTFALIAAGLHRHAATPRARAAAIRWQTARARRLLGPIP